MNSFSVIYLLCYSVKNSLNFKTKICGGGWCCCCFCLFCDSTVFSTMGFSRSITYVNIVKLSFIRSKQKEVFILRPNEMALYRVYIMWWSGFFFSFSVRDQIAFFPSFFFYFYIFFLIYTVWWCWIGLSVLQSHPNNKQF